MSSNTAFIIPRSRTGGTLFATMLGAHPGLSMAYEIYPEKLCDSHGKPFAISELITTLKASYDVSAATWVKQLPNNNFRVFCARARRSGLEPEIILEELSNFYSAGGHFNDLYGQLDFIDLLLNRQRTLAKKQFCGGKMRVDPFILQARNPNSTFFMMIRDGRDVFDSRQNTGDLKLSAEECARDWVTSILEFENFLCHGANGCFIKYEELVVNPEAMLKQAFSHLPIDYHENMLNYVESNPALLNAPHGHLSANQIFEGLNSSSIGRWKRSSKKEDIQTFMSIAKETMLKFGYQ